MTALIRRSPRILVLGGGYVGLFTALQLRKRLGRKEATIAIVDPRPYMTYQPFLPEAAAGSLEPRHVITNLRATAKGASIISGRVTGLRHAARVATIEPLTGEPYDLKYDHVVLALGAVARVLPIPGLAETGIGFKQIEEAIDLQNRVLGMMEAASSTWDHEERRRMLTFTFVGGGFAGIEALGEVEDMARSAADHFDAVSREDLRFVLIEASDRILPEVGEELGEYALKQLRRRGIDIKLGTFLNSAVDGHIVTSDGDEFESETLVWTAGVKANPALANTDLSLDERGRVRTNARLQAVTADGRVVPGAWAAGDNAAVPDLTSPGDFCGPTAQHAVRQAKLLGDNIAATLHGKPVLEYRHKNLGTVASLGLYKGVATVFGLKLRGPLAWFMHRTYHMWAMPTFNRKVRIVLDWTMALLFRREMVSLGSVENPHAEFQSVAAPADPREPAA
ncbi:MULTISPECIES: NAD(P)/FAD-dependent oxidoreductase [unclassified Pseudactinotalea]|uniref:NAD(P)/FAD-dependent oxidoreductase n=1 Tax=unclassified Pseudactinotalea TaxID=2649176 RepID=UPI00128D9746|nr:MULTISPECIES: NAD(P)/FAD-dependent oxidoreductase [unclassified Pseudactinotalea]MPV48709.1 NAD(P)/FAD-dependent oxidoreductase [Pseudactinotalea sp. HY160]QGH68674.1 NAD(P)/FAD-dependent oxidoreductase [Pseudactinotalea sp. HY158]